MSINGYKSQPLEFSLYQDGEKGDTGTSVVSITTTYVLQANTVDLTTWNQADLDSLTWTDTPPRLQLDHTIWKRETTIFSNGEIETAPPVKDDALNSTYELAQGKTTNYYSSKEPTLNSTLATNQPSKYFYASGLKEDDCWFDTSLTDPGINLNDFDTAAKYIGYYIKVMESGKEKKYRVTAENYKTLEITPKVTLAYSSGVLKQCVNINSETGDASWIDIGGELVANKITANYINALDITAKKITVFNNNETLFQADGTSDEGVVTIGGFTVTESSLCGGDGSIGANVRLYVDNNNDLAKIENTAYFLNDLVTYKGAYNSFSTEKKAFQEDEEGLVDVSCFSGATEKSNVSIVWNNTTSDTDYQVQNYSRFKFVETNLVGKADVDATSFSPGFGCIRLDVLEDIAAETLLYLGIQNSIYATEAALDCMIALKPLPTNLLEYTNTLVSSPITASHIFNKIYDANSKIFKEAGESIEYTTRPENGDIGTTLIYSIAAQTTDRHLDGGVSNLLPVAYPDLKAGTSILIYYISRNPNTGTKHIDAYSDNEYSAEDFGYGEVFIPKTINTPKMAFEVGNNFRVSSTGKLYAKDVTLGGTLIVNQGGSFAGIRIAQNELQNEGFKLSKKGLQLPLKSRLKIGTPETEELNLFVKSSPVMKYGELKDANGNGTGNWGYIETGELLNTSYIRSFRPLCIQYGLDGGGINLKTVSNTSFINKRVKLTWFSTSSTSAASIMPVRDVQLGKDHFILQGESTGGGNGGSDLYKTFYVNITGVVEYFDKTTSSWKNDGEGLGIATNVKFTLHYYDGSKNLKYHTAALYFPASATTLLNTYTITTDNSTNAAFAGVGLASGSDLVTNGNTGKIVHSTTVSTNTDKDNTDNTFIELKGQRVDIKAKNITLDSQSADGITKVPYTFAVGNSDTSPNFKVFYSSGTTYMKSSTSTLPADTGSDIKLKKDISYIATKPHYEKFFDLLKPAEFKYLEEPLRVHTGFIAQDILEAQNNIFAGKDALNMVKISPETGRYGIVYNSIIALNTAEIQRLKAKVAALEAKIEELSKC